MTSCVVLSRRACVWHSCCPDPFAEGGEETVKEISWKKKLSLVCSVVDGKLLHSSLSRI